MGGPCSPWTGNLDDHRVYNVVEFQTNTIQNSLAEPERLCDQAQRPGDRRPDSRSSHSRMAAVTGGVIVFIAKRE